PEFAHPYEVLAPHTQISIASPLGGAAPLDPSSVEASTSDAVSVKFLKDRESLWKNTEKLSSFLGPMFDLATDATSHTLINEFYTHNKIISAVCHGPAALTHVKLPSGGFLLDGQPVTGFSNAEEDAVGLSAVMPFSLEDKLSEASGGRFEKAKEAWSPHVVIAREGRLITGQNPASAGPLGQKVYEAIFGDLKV
ncbi:Glyoxalase, partial [Lachnellula subtilissima]